ncbi:MAG: alpha/beta fold hydrolase [Gemmatimonadetes bacterium]|jgi:3-oxoadipate enol-lactonase|nr:alpha/beta fold hydrolase [Gemmatimonadota bacterium]MBK9410598.1 alpha/beta fold hydrolase [Gemmatimonadota bacterium]HNV74832.1 alpha/beta fold hydrolase [Gemmatimonadaceae bacterium]
MIAYCGGIEIGYDDMGSGDAVVFLHGFPHHRALWASQVAALVDRARCIAPDLRGFGESSVHPPYSVDQYADDLAALLDSLRIERAVVCGLSMGGYVALAFWRRHRARVRALILMDTRAGNDSAEGRERRDQMIALARQRGSEAVADAMITGMVGKRTREKCPEVVDDVHRMLESAPVDGVVGALEALRDRPDSTATLETIDVPTLIVVGEDDVLTPPGEAMLLHAGIRGSTLEVIAGAGHVANVERPAAVNHVITEFLAKVTLS